MDLTLAYRGHSTVTRGAGGLAVSLAPNLRRDRVSFDGRLLHPVRFREALAALHDVVISDLRFQPKDRSAHDAHRAEVARGEAERRRLGVTEARTTLREGLSTLEDPYPEGIDVRYRTLRRAYWDARQRYSNQLHRRDVALWRRLIPCDPVITVAPDCLFLECFSADESSYGCLTVDREAFAGTRDVALGTTNVDYSWALHEHFQRLRSYRETRFLVDPSGFEVRTEATAGYREEKIALPPSWLRGFLQLQAAMSLPARRVPISREGLYGVLAFLKRNRAAKSPRAVRFELVPGRPVTIVLEPWERRIVLHGTPYDGPAAETIRIWGRDRLLVLARLLPLLDEAEVYLLGTGLPSFWSARMGEMRLLLGLSGWTANDWSSGSALDQLSPPTDPDAALLGAIAATFRDHPSQSFEQICTHLGATPARAAAGLNRLALLGQLIHDLHAGLYRWRQILPVAVSADQIGPEPPETAAARQLVADGKVGLVVDRPGPGEARILEGTVGDRPVSLALDADGRMVRGKCSCSHHFKGGLRRGPCRHLQALRDATGRAASPTTLGDWFTSLTRRIPGADDAGRG